MKYVYVAGLEHSGTTLLAQLLGSQSKVLAIGEVGQFLSQLHMKQYLAEWGNYPDVTRCSCGQDWSRCPLWSGLMSLNGRFEGTEISTGYGRLLAYLSEMPDDLLVVDTSKSLAHLEALKAAWRVAGYSTEDILVIVVAKDPRGFAWSIQRKLRQRGSMLSALRSMNWWNGSYRRLFACAESDHLSAVYVTYEQICNQPTIVLEKLGRHLHQFFVSEAEISHAKSHIALGNKNFIERNRTRIVYDEEWKRSWLTRAAYAINIPVRSAWRTFQEKATWDNDTVAGRK